jgi:hypothetical protein
MALKSLPPEFSEKTNILRLHANGAKYSEVGHLGLVKRNVPIVSTSGLLPLVDFFCDTLNRNLIITGNPKIKALEEDGVRTRTFFFLKTTEGNIATREPKDTPGRVQNLVIPNVYSNLKNAILVLDLTPKNFHISFDGKGKPTLEITSEDFKIFEVPQIENYGGDPNHPLKIIVGFGNEESLFIPRFEDYTKGGPNKIRTRLMLAPKICSFGCLECHVEFDFHMGYEHYLELYPHNWSLPILALNGNSEKETITRAPLSSP